MITALLAAIGGGLMLYGIGSQTVAPIAKQARTLDTQAAFVKGRNTALAAFIKEEGVIPLPVNKKRDEGWAMAFCPDLGRFVCVDTDEDVALTRALKHIAGERLIPKDEVRLVKANLLYILGDQKRRSRLMVNKFLDAEMLPPDELMQYYCRLVIEENT